MTRQQQVKQLAKELGVEVQMLPPDDPYATEGNAFFNPVDRSIKLSHDPDTPVGYLSAMHELGHAADFKAGRLRAPNRAAYYANPEDVVEDEVTAWEWGARPRTTGGQRGHAP